MFQGKRLAAVIPARGGSKALPGKNIRPLGGKPLLAWSVEVAREVPEIDRVIVSTDDEAIAAVARQYGAEVYERPACLATDDALVIDALRDLFRTLSAEGEHLEWALLLEPTCPLRNAEDVRACLKLASQRGFDSVATFKEAELHPHRAWKLQDGLPEPFIPGAVPWMPRQKLPAAHQLNGAVYLFRTGLLHTESNSLLVGKAGAVLMPRERSQDIDHVVDFMVAEALFQSSGL